MLNLQYVLDRFALITNLEQEQLSRWIPLCNEAATEIERKIKPQIQITEDTIQRLSSAAGHLGFYRYLLCQSASDPCQSFSNGDLKIQSDSKQTIEFAFKSWQEAKASIADLLQDEDFYFERVRCL